MSISIFVLCLCFCSVFGYNTYKAAVADVAKGDVNSGKYADFVYEAAKMNVDVVVLPSPKNIPSEGALELCMNELDNYDEIVESVSTAAKEGQVYVVAHLYEKTHCQNKQELIRSNLVFDRHGSIVSVYRKPLNTLSKCNTTMLKSGRFSTDFGVTFAILMEEDILLNNAREFDGIKNFIVAGSFVPKTSILFAKQFPSSWAYVNNFNLITANGILGGNIDMKTSPKQLIVAEFTKEPRNDVPRPLTVTPDSFSTGDLSRYSIKPLNLDASSQGYTEVVCQGSFCCQFYVKTSLIGSKQDITYGLVAFDGTHQLGANYIGVQTCSAVACAGLYKRSCFVGSENNKTNIKFEKITVNGNFSEENSAQFPSILTSTQEVFKKDDFKFTVQNENFKHVTAELYKKENVLNFGIFGRVYSRDYDTSGFGTNNTDNISDFSEYISSENVQEFFDYLWIRLRVIIFIVSIYVLEMM